MKRLLWLLPVLVFAQCSDDDRPACDTLATVRNLTGLDGCGYVLELENGTRLEPELILRCGTPPQNDDASKENDNALLSFELVDGKRVLISYEETGGVSTCMIGPIVKITCIQEVIGPAED